MRPPSMVFYRYHGYHASADRESPEPTLVICPLVQPYMYEPGRLTRLTTHPRLVQYLWRIAATED